MGLQIYNKIKDSNIFNIETLPATVQAQIKEEGWRQEGYPARKKKTMTDTSQRETFCVESNKRRGCERRNEVENQSQNFKHWDIEGKELRDCRHGVKKAGKYPVLTRDQVEGDKAKLLAEEYKLFYSSAEKESRNGVGIIADNDLKEEVCGVDGINDRTMSIKLTIRGDVITVLSVCTPDGITMEIPDNERVIIEGDLNEHVGERRSGEDRIYGGWSYGERNAAGHKTAEYAVSFDPMIASTYFNHRREQLIMYRSGDHKSQLDNLLTRRKYIKEIKNTKVIYRESVAAQHKLIVADYEMGVGKRLKLPEDVQERWSYNSNVIAKAGKDNLCVTTGKRPPEEQWDLRGIQEDREAYKTAKKMAKRAVAKAKAETMEKAYEELERRQDTRQLLWIAKARDKARHMKSWKEDRTPGNSYGLLKQEIRRPHNINDVDKR
ncbi:uncharacterized protein LOC126474446 [Schistocerca serialis cubense]|uniref:uncharacterized protein LOC126474446 n=1 Tax=Schistocerca serialis cubense TaxID=2023355 RepID=UPI00214E5D91|nr:uncharacterized protein LOC126474446 [Schistocerca serialis cubense]